MFQGQRLSYIVPGYTGHIPKKVYDQFVPLEKKQPTSYIPGYAGYVKAIKSENLHAETFGKTTLKVNSDNYVRGQDIATRHKYVTSATDTNIPPSQMLQKTAADIVGVPNKKIVVKDPKLSQSKGPQVDQFKQTKTEQFRQSLRNTKNKWANSSVVQKNGKEYVELGNPLPGYTGFGKRILANNIFGKTFAQCQRHSSIDTHKLTEQKKKNFHNQLNIDPPLKF